MLAAICCHVLEFHFEPQVDFFSFNGQGEIEMRFICIISVEQFFARSSLPQNSTNVTRYTLPLFSIIDDG